MAGRKRLYLYWDPAIDAGLRRALEAALGRLNVDAADGDAVDVDPETPGVVAVVASPEGEWSPPARPDIVIQGGAGKFTPAPGAIRLTIHDIRDEGPQWTKLVRQLSTKLGLASLALPADELEIALNATAQRADEAERNMSAALLNEANALRENRQLQLDMAKAHERIAELERENARLANLNQSGRFALGAVPETLRESVSQAREFARRAELAAARAPEAAAAFPDAIAWSGALYSGETRNGRPHGHGVMTFAHGQSVSAGYRSDFAEGKSAGLGVGVANEGLVWSGQWAADEACGFGILEAPDGRRFEGRVKAGASGAPVAEQGWNWSAPDSARRKPTHHELAPSLPAPAAE